MFALTGIGNAGQAMGTDESTSLKKIRATGVISVGYRTGSFPFSYLDETLQPIGYSMDICKHIVVAIRKRLGLRTLNVQLIRMTPATRIPLVANGTVDLECGVTTNTKERRNNVAFSVTTFVTESRLVSKREAPVSTIEDLRGRSVVTTIGTTSMHYLNDLNARRHLGMDILAGQDDLDSFLMLKSGRAQAYAMDEVLLRAYIAKENTPEAYVISRDALSVEPYGIMLNKNDPIFKRVVDQAIFDLFRSGEIHRIYRRWFLEEIPGLRINLNIPMSAVLRRILQTPSDSLDSADY